MAHFDVFANPDRSERSHTPFILDLQNSFLDMIDTFVAVPLRCSEVMPVRIAHVQPLFEIKGMEVVMDAPMMATFPKRGLGQPVANLSHAKSEIQGALDSLFGAH